MNSSISNEGLKQYLYEYVIYQSINYTSSTFESPIMVSQARNIRQIIDEKLAARGRSIADPTLEVRELLPIINETLPPLPTGEPLFGDGTLNNAAYQQLLSQFCDSLGISHRNAQNQMVQPNIHSERPGLPISPYDPRFSGRATVKQQGSKLLYVDLATLEMIANNNPSRVAGSTSAGLKLSYLRDTDNGPVRKEAGPSYTLDDASGMSALMGYMSEREYNAVRGWVNQAGYTDEGTIDVNKYMTPKAVARAVALLEELGEQGATYTVSRDRFPGQIKARIDGTRIEIRLTEPRVTEQYVGRVYDDGMEVYFTTTLKDKTTNEPLRYDASPKDCVSLLRYVQGLPVERNDGKGLVGEINQHLRPMWNRSIGRYEDVPINDAYFSGATHSAVLGSLSGIDGGYVMIRRDASARSAASRMFKSADEAFTYLDNAVTSARDNLTAALNVDGLVAEAEQWLRDPERDEDYVPVMHGDTQIAAIQRAYWSILTGKNSHLLTFDGASEDFYSAMTLVRSLEETDENIRASVFDSMVDGVAYVGDPVDQVKAHSLDVVDALVGTLDAQMVITSDAENGLYVNKRFDPVTVAQFMTGDSAGVWRNNDEIIEALRVTKINPDELRGSQFYNKTIKDRLVEFDPSTARDMSQVDDPFIQSMRSVIIDSLKQNTCEVTSLAIDDNGIVSWKGVRRSAMRVQGKKGQEVVSGTLGQIFAPGKHGEVITQFAGGGNYMFVPGYEASIVSQKPGENLSVEERTRLHGYEQIMAERIHYQISRDLLTERTELGSTTSINDTYRKLYTVRHPVDYIEKAQEEGLSQDWVETILATEARRVRYSNEVRDGSTLHAATLNSLGNFDPANDNYRDMYVLTGQRNMSLLGEERRGYFDPSITGGGTNQGITVYLVESAQVDVDGRIIRGDVTDRTPLMKHPDTAFMSYDPFDRQQMTGSNILQASAITRPVNVAMMTLGGWTADDPLVVSQRFADTYKVRGVDGEMRPLQVGDKLSDFHGNKGVISLIVDPEMSPEEAEAQQIAGVVEVFASNPDLDVAMSPFSAVSRFNGGTAREMMRNPQDLHIPGKGTVAGGMGQLSLIVTHMSADAKTKIYDDEAIARGGGRKASSQLAWALGSLGAHHVLAECYGNNGAALSNVREMLITCGLDMTPDGTLRVGYESHGEGDERRLLEIGEIARNANGGLDRSTMRSRFGQLIGDKGGDLELPFPLFYPTGGELEYNGSGWKLPVMSSHLRSGQELGDGTSTVHDYTNHYLTVYENAVKYRFAQERLADPSYTDVKGRANLQKFLAEAPMRAQFAFDAITQDLKTRRFSGKHNVVRDMIMSSRMPYSATAVASSDPRLDIDELGMSSAMAEFLGVNEGDYIIVWRDPLIRDAGVKAMRARIDDRLTGISINPASDKPYEADFDGDTMAIVALKSKAAIKEAIEKLSFGATLLDKSAKDSEGFLELCLQNSLDSKVSQHENPELVEDLKVFKIRANDLLEDTIDGNLSFDEIMKERELLVAEISDLYRDSMFGSQIGGAVLQFGSVQDHIDSVIKSCVETGAKGNMAKVHDYARYLGVVIDQQGRVFDQGRTLHTAQDELNSQIAVSVKAFDTGTAGSMSQRAVSALRDTALEPALETTSAATQSALQSKHDAAEAENKHKMLRVARFVWQGNMIMDTVEYGVPTWKPMYEKGAPVRASRDEWVDAFYKFYTSPHGLNVEINRDHVEALADALVDPETGEMRNIEEDMTLGLPLDKLAYGGTFDTWKSYAEQGVNIFDSKMAEDFAPFVVRNNLRAIRTLEDQLSQRIDQREQLLESTPPWERTAEFDALMHDLMKPFEEPELTPIVKKDTQASYPGRTARVTSPLARPIGMGYAEQAAAHSDKYSTPETGSSDEYERY